MHLVAANEDIYEGVEGDICRSQAHFLHMVKELLGFSHHTLLRTAFDQSVERHFINMEKVTLPVFKEKLDNLNGLLNLIALDATVQENIEQDFSAFRTND